MRLIHLIEFIEKLIDRLSDFIKNRTESDRIQGALMFRIERGKTRIYRRDDPKQRNGVYIPKTEIETIKPLAQQEYEDTIYGESHKTILALQKCLGILRNCKDPDDINENLSEFKGNLLTEIKSPNIVDIEKWKDRPPYKKLRFYKADKFIVTRRGMRVRSKTEEIAANIFDDLGIPYIFEYLIIIDKDWLYPDFLVLNVRTGKEYVYEHFGQMDDEHYLKYNFLRKLELYAKKGIFPGDNLVMTFETKDNPLNEQYLLDFIKKNFL